MSSSRAARRARVAAHRSSTKHVARPFLGSILGLLAVAETICPRAEGTVAGAPVLGQRLGRAQHHRVVAAVTVRRRQQIAENSINVHLPLELAWLTVHWARHSSSRRWQAPERGGSSQDGSNGAMTNKIYWYIRSLGSRRDDTSEVTQWTNTLE